MSRIGQTPLEALSIFLMSLLGLIAMILRVLLRCVERGMQALELSLQQSSAVGVGAECSVHVGVLMREIPGAVGAVAMTRGAEIFHPPTKVLCGRGRQAVGYIH